jgi:hypothetical protein
MTRVEEKSLMARPPELSDPSVTSVRVRYSDLHGIAPRTGAPYIASLTPLIPFGGGIAGLLVGTRLRTSKPDVYARIGEGG